MKKNKKIVLISIAIIAIILAFVGGNAFAKYMSKVTGKGTANVAKWSFKVDGSEAETMKTVSLSSTINDKTLKGNQIAPGTEGSFKIDLDASESEVGINYFVTFDKETTKPTNLKFLYNGNTYDTLAKLQEDLHGEFSAVGSKEEKQKELVIGWKWEYRTGNTEEIKLANDKIDTQEGKTIEDYSFDIIVSGTQIAPTNTSNN